jgi:hypothetical protein
MPPFIVLGNKFDMKIKMGAQRAKIQKYKKMII